MSWQTKTGWRGHNAREHDGDPQSGKACSNRGRRYPFCKQAPPKSSKEMIRMGVASRTTPLLVIGLAMIGCGKDPAETGLSQSRPTGNVTAQSRPKADQLTTEASSSLLTVKLQIPGMS
jgi:hypothetical protein